MVNYGLFNTRSFMEHMEKAYFNFDDNFGKSWLQNTIQYLADTCNTPEEMVQGLAKMLPCGISDYEIRDYLLKV